jgi:NhaP-type Na+/H+ and K+/H+ antiporter
VAEVFAFYGLQPSGSDATLGEWIGQRLQRAPVVGDTLQWGQAHFAVRAMDGPRVTRVGLAIHAE